MMTLDDLVVMLAATVDVLAKDDMDETRITFVIDRKKLDREVLIEDADSLLIVLRENLLRLKEIDEKETYFKSRRPGATAADCIGFLYQQKALLEKEPAGLARDLGRRFLDATVAHLQELHGRREAADKDAYKRREEAAEAAREKRRAYEKQNAERERAYKQKQHESATGQQKQYRSPFEEYFTGRAYTEEQIRKARERMEEEMYRTFHSAFDGDPFGFYSAKDKENKKTRPSGSGTKWFEVLGVSAGADKKTINDAWRKLAKQHHPDRAGGSNEKMSQINAARDEGLGGLL